MRKAVLPNQVNMLPSQRSDVGKVLFRNDLTLLSQLFNSLGKVHCIPGCDGRHDQMQTACAMHLVFKCAIPEFPMFAGEELAGQSMEGLTLIEPDENPAAKCFILEVVQQKTGPFERARAR